MPDRSSPSSPKPEVSEPSFTVIVPTRDRPDRLRVCLDALSGLDYPEARFDVVVVDDGGSAALEEVVRPFAQRMRVGLARQAPRGPGSARNLGASYATGAYLAFTDDDCVPRRNWLRAYAAAFADGPDALLGGRVVTPNARGALAVTSGMLIDYQHEHHTLFRGGPAFFPANNMALAAAHFHAIGGFDAGFPGGFAEDREFGERWWHAGGKLRLIEDAKVEHHDPLGFPAFCRRHMADGRGTRRLKRVLAGKGLPPRPAEPLGFHLNRFAYPFRLGASAPLKYAALIGVARLAHACGHALPASGGTDEPARHRRHGRRAVPGHNGT